ncbi:MAG: hypothetical protein FRX49_05097 [Trebouxia sp. A1-2]|nr:MAG: hypothetical protein FRX49_05097 [Trebouxia sp. A1-2]
MQDLLPTAQCAFKLTGVQFIHNKGFPLLCGNVPSQQECPGDKTDPEGAAGDVEKEWRERLFRLGGSLGGPTLPAKLPPPMLPAKLAAPANLWEGTVRDDANISPNTFLPLGACHPPLRASRDPTGRWADDICPSIGTGRAIGLALTDPKRPND